MSRIYDTNQYQNTWLRGKKLYSVQGSTCTGICCFLVHTCIASCFRNLLLVTGQGVRKGRPYQLVIGVFFKKMKLQDVFTNIIPQQQNLRTGVFSPEKRCNTRFRRRFLKVPVQKADEVPESSGAAGGWGSGRFRCKWLMFWGRLLIRFRRVPGQKTDEVPAQIADKFRKVPGHMADEVPGGWLQGSGADSQKLSKIFEAVGDNTWVYLFHFIYFY